MPATVCTWKAGDKLPTGDQTQVVRLGWQVTLPAKPCHQPLDFVLKCSRKGGRKLKKVSVEEINEWLV